MSLSIPSVLLNSGHRMPLIALGCIEFVRDKKTVADSVYDAITLGYRHFDTAWIYETERFIGEGVARAISEGLVKREDLFLSSKVWVTDLRPEALAAQARESVANLSSGYLDLLLIHAAEPLGGFKRESHRKEQLRENADLFSFDLDDEDRAALASLHRDDGSCIPDFFRRLHRIDGATF